MGETFDTIDPRLEEFIRAQRIFFVATAPLSATGHVNVSPKGLDTLRVLDAQRLAYLDYVGSGAETIAHLRENGRIVLMLCAFEGAPRIVRLHGRGSVFEPHDQEFTRLRGMFPSEPSGRAIVHISVDRIADSCGYGVPSYTFEEQRSQLSHWAARKGPQGLREYQVQKNSTSIDGLQALRWPVDDTLTKVRLTPACAGAFLVRRGSVLLGLRSPTRTTYPNVWDCIGGHARPGESPREALLRELEEEIQVTPTEFRELATLADPQPGNDAPVTYHIFVVTDWTGSGPIAAGDEHAEIRWFPIPEAVGLQLAHPGYVALLNGLRATGAV